MEVGDEYKASRNSNVTIKITEVNRRRVKYTKYRYGKRVKSYNKRKSFVREWYPIAINKYAKQKQQLRV